MVKSKDVPEVEEVPVKEKVDLGKAKQKPTSKAKAEPEANTPARRR
jgi:hypothetical protein